MRIGNKEEKMTNWEKLRQKDIRPPDWVLWLIITIVAVFVGLKKMQMVMGNGGE